MSKTPSPRRWIWGAVAAAAAALVLLALLRPGGSDDEAGEASAEARAPRAPARRSAASAGPPPAPVPTDGGECALRVAVVDLDGRPVSGATVDARLNPGGKRAPQATPASGEVRFAGALCGASASVYLPPTAGHLDAFAIVQPEVIVAGEVVTLVADPGREAWEIVQDPSGAPIVGARVIGSVGEDTIHAGDDPTGADGRYSLRVPTAPLVGLIATAPGHAMGSDDLVWADPDAPSQRLDLTLDPERHVTLTCLGLDGGCRSAFATCEPAAGGSAHPCIHSAHTPEGEMDFERVACTCPAGWARIAAEGVHTEIGPDATEATLDFSTLGRIHARVLLDGAPAQGCIVFLQRAAPERPLNVFGWNSGPPASCDRGGSGSLEMTGVADGSWMLQVRASGDGSSASRAYGPVEVRGNATVEVGDVEARWGGAVEGVVQRADGEPLPYADVVATPEPSVRGAAPIRDSTDEEGRFRLDGLAPGTWRLSQGPPSDNGVGVQVDDGAVTDGLILTPPSRRALPGTGVSIALVDDALVVESVAEGSLAAAAGLSPGDALVGIYGDGVEIRLDEEGTTGDGLLATLGALAAWDQPGLELTVTDASDTEREVSLGW